MFIFNDKLASTPPVNEYPVAASTALSIGQLVVLSGGLVVQAAVNGTAAILGICVEYHPGTADPLNPRADGTRVRVADSPAALYFCAAPVLTATGGSTTTVVSTGLAAFDNDVFNGGRLMLLTKGTSSANTDPVGTLYTISDFTGSATKTFTIGTAGGAVTSGDTFLVFPPIGCSKGLLTSGRDAYTVNGDTAVSLPLRVIGWDLESRRILLVPQLHELANSRT